MSTTSSRGNRPLSPHLSIYKPIPTMVMSILHRITGVALYFSMALFSWWLFAAATGAEYFNWVNGLFGSWFGRVVLFGISLVLIHHMLGGLKHLVQDTGRAMEKHFTTKMAMLHPVVSIVLTLIVWAMAYWAR
jgi:succinate dehydrogenase / fumarate reductase cytochrome b subunit